MARGGRRGGGGNGGGGPGGAPVVFVPLVGVQRGGEAGRAGVRRGITVADMTIVVVREVGEDGKLVPVEGEGGSEDESVGKVDEGDATTRFRTEEGREGEGEKGEVARDTFVSVSIDADDVTAEGEKHKEGRGRREGVEVKGAVWGGEGGLERGSESLPVRLLASGEPCAICLDEFQNGDRQGVLRCGHGEHCSFKVLQTNPRVYHAD